MYVRPNFKTKKALKDAIAHGESVTIYSPGPFPPVLDGMDLVEGPHVPVPHSWYAQVQVVNGFVVKVVN